jgi:hypothetical protein
VSVANERDFERMTKTHVCAVCGSLLVMPYDPERGGRILVCAADRAHTVFRRVGSLRERWKRGQPVPPDVARHFAREKGAAPMDTQALVAMSEQQMLARINQARFPKDLTPVEKGLLVRVALDYGLDPAMSELIIYQGRPYVTIDGRRRKAQETGLLDGVSTRPATQEERQSWDIPEGDYFFFAEVWRKGASRPFIGYGRVRKAETKPQGAAGFRPIENDPQGMAAKRAEARALRMAFSVPLPSAETAGTSDDDIPYVDVEARELPDVDHETGELHPPTSAADITRSDEAPDNGSQPPPAAGPDPRLEKVTTTQHLFNACRKHFPEITNWAQILAMLGHKDPMEIADAGEAWATVCAQKMAAE